MMCLVKFEGDESDVLVDVPPEESEIRLDAIVRKVLELHHVEGIPRLIRPLEPGIVCLLVCESDREDEREDDFDEAATAAADVSPEGIACLPYEALIDALEQAHADDDPAPESSELAADAADVADATDAE